MTVALDVQDGFVRDARVALGGVATVPWRAREVEMLLKDELGQRVVALALYQAATMEI